MGCDETTGLVKIMIYCKDERLELTKEPICKTLKSSGSKSKTKKNTYN